MTSYVKRYSVQTIKCEDDACARSFPDNKKGAVRARDEGWFIQRSGAVWCPCHIPSWVPNWRRHLMEA